MRVSNQGSRLRVRAIAGLHVVTLGWDFAKPAALTAAGAVPVRLRTLLGFAIERSEIAGNGVVVERYMLRGIKRFRNKDQGLAPGSPVRLDDHPVQSFVWADYTVKPGATYEYRVIPLHGKPKNIELRTANAVSVRVTCEQEVGSPGPGGAPRHDIYFNRGVIGSQAYARRYENKEPDRNNPGSDEMKWLSRGLFEGFKRFIAEAKDGDSLHCAFYEFHYRPAAALLRTALDAGVNVRIVYDAESSYAATNEHMLHEVGLDGARVAIPRRQATGIRHNKFMVLSRGDQPVAVWTGSTNLSAGGIFGHSNVGHVVWDGVAARKFRDYWDLLASDPTPAPARTRNLQLTPLAAGKPPVGVTPIFSPRDKETENTTLQWYADRMAEATQIACITVAFNLDATFQRVIEQENDVLRFIVKDDDLGTGESIGRDRDVLFAAGGKLEAGALANFLEERGNPLNTNDYIHTKFMLVDPLGPDPLVVSGSANFSKPSQRTNDENMLVIRGDTRTADIYFGEFMRIFDHHYARYVVKKLRDAGRGDPDAGYLKESADTWLKSHLDPNSYKAKRRRYFAG